MSSLTSHCGQSGLNTDLGSETRAHLEKGFSLKDAFSRESGDVGDAAESVQISWSVGAAHFRDVRDSRDPFSELTFLTWPF